MAKQVSNVVETVNVKLAELQAQHEQAKRKHERSMERKAVLDAATALAPMAKQGVKRVKDGDKDGRTAVKLQYSTKGIAGTCDTVADAIIAIAESFRTLGKRADALHGDTMADAHGRAIRFKDAYGAVAMGLTDTAREVSEHSYGAIAKESAALAKELQALEAAIVELKGA